jgi:Copper binding proteins, plastocyanin/azurin family.
VKTLVLDLALGSILSLAAGCGSSVTSLSTSVSPPPDFTFEQHNYYFSPTVLPGAFSTANKITIQVRNAADRQHTFTIDEFGVDVTLQPGETQTVTVNNVTGNYTFYCRFHRAQGMVGNLPLNHESPTR